MSIVNISSENAVGPDQGVLSADGAYNNAEFTTRFKKPLTQCIGVQLLQATVPLTYQLINETTDSSPS